MVGEFVCKVVFVLNPTTVEVDMQLGLSWGCDNLRVSKGNLFLDLKYLTLSAMAS